MKRILFLGMALMLATAGYAQLDSNMEPDGQPKRKHALIAQNRRDNDRRDKDRRDNNRRDSATVQRRKQNYEQMQARKVAYFTTQIDLTTEEAQAFWPLYNEYWKKRDALFSERRQLIRKANGSKGNSQPTDDEATQISQRLVENMQDDVSLLREYSTRFTKVLPPQKLLKYYLAEESFKMELIKELKK